MGRSRKRYRGEAIFLHAVIWTRLELDADGDPKILAGVRSIHYSPIEAARAAHDANKASPKNHYETSIVPIRAGQVRRLGDRVGMKR